MGLDEGAARKRPFTTRRDVEHLHNRVNMRRKRKGSRDWFGGVQHQRIGRVNIKVQFARDIGGYATPREPTDIFQNVLKPGEIVQVTQGGRAVKPGIEVKRLNRGPTSAEIHPIAANFDRPVRVAAMQDKLFGRLVDRLFDQSAGKGQAPLFPDLSCLNRACRYQVFAQACGNLAHTQLFQQAQRGIIDSVQSGFAQRFIGPTGLPRRAGVHLWFCSPFCQTVAAPGSSGSVFLPCHPAPLIGFRGIAPAELAETPSP